jgi:hypothetical protein
MRYNFIVFIICIAVPCASCPLAAAAGRAEADRGAPVAIAPRYESELLKQFEAKARDVIRGEDRNAAWDAVKVAYDLRRSDLLAAALGGRDSAVRLLALEYLKRLPIESQRKALVLSLADGEVFPPPRENKKLEQARLDVLEEYRSFAKSVCRHLDMRTTGGALDIEDKAVRDRLRARLANVFAAE